MWVLVNGEYWKNVSGEESDRIVVKNIIEDPSKKVRKPRAKKVKA